MFLLYTVVVFVCLYTNIECQDQTKFILSSIGDHGDRISDLEGAVNALKAEYRGLLGEVSSLRQENTKLKSEIQNLATQCNRSQCCNGDQRGSSETTTSAKTTATTVSTIETTATLGTTKNETTSINPFVTTNSTETTITTAAKTPTTTTKPVITSRSPNATSITTTSTPFATTNSPDVTVLNSAKPITTIPTTPTTAKPITTTKSTTEKPNTTTSTKTTTSTIPNTTTKTTTTTRPITTTTRPATTEITTTTGTTTRETTAAVTTERTTTTNAESVFDDCVTAVNQGRVPSQGDVVPIKVGTTGLTIQARCDADGWLVIQRRQDGSQDFNQDWNTYKKGFGDLDGEFWLGNDKIYQLTNNDDYTLRIEMEDWAQNEKYAEYEHFRIENEYQYYTLFVGSYSGTAGDSFHYRESYQLSHHHMRFSTPDRDDDMSFQNCADKLSAGWWFNDCYSSNLNGPYLQRPYGQRTLGETFGQPTLEGTGIEWYPLQRHQYSLKKVVMKIKPSVFHSSLVG